MASLAWLHAGGLEQLTLDAVASPWIEAPRGVATRGWQPGAVTATRAVQLGGGVALEMVAPLPERVRVGETLLLHVRAVGPSGRPAVGWPIELELRTEARLALKLPIFFPAVHQFVKICLLRACVCVCVCVSFVCVCHCIVGSKGFGAANATLPWVGKI
jgi:hypothetical protein